VATPNPEQLRRREQIESAIRLAAPALNLVLAVGERISRIVEPGDPEYYPPRVTTEEPPPKSSPAPGRED
jgi:hypothetical protein